MKSGFCIKCGSNEVHIYKHERNDMGFSFRADVEEYICFECGYSEQYFLESSLHVMRNRKAQKQRSKNKSKIDE